MNNNTKIKPNIFARLKLLIVVSTSFVCPLVQSEVTLDGSLGATSALRGPDFQITENMGTRAGSNLFHSFGRFNLNKSQSATFSGSPGINNVIGRVTGGQASTIDGTLRVSIPNANLYLLNPAGVIFGENATLDVPGSFHTSTANYLKLQDGVRFDSGAATTPQVLTTAAPEAFGFLGGNPSGILLTGATNSVLEVQQGSTVSLIGGDITSESTAIYAPGGQINLASVGSAGEVVLNESGIQTTSFQQMGSISLSQDPLIPHIASGTDRVLGNLDVSSDTGGKIFIRGGQLVMDNSYIFSDTQTGDGGGINVGLTNDLNMRAPKASSPERPTGSLITSSTSGKGNAGNINLDAGKLILSDRAQINTRAVENSTGNAGNLTISANTIQLQNHPDVTTLLTTASLGNGDAGNIAMTTDTLEVLGGSVIESTTGGKGNGGNLTMDAKKILLSGENSAFFTSSLDDSTGNAGDLSIIAETMKVSDSAVIQSVSSGSGNGGNLLINADNLEVLNGARIDNSVYSSGNGGDLMISASGLRVSDEARIDNSIYGSGNSGNLMITATDLDILNSSIIQSNAKTETKNKGGDLTIEADTISLSGIDTEISSEASGKGISGNVTITSGKLELRNGSEISSRTSDQGNGSNMVVDSNEIILANDTNAIASSAREEKSLRTGIHADLLGDNLKAKSGNFTIKSENLTVNNGASITANNFDQGKSGNLFVKSDQINLTNDADAIALSRKGAISLSTGIHADLLGDSPASKSGNLTIKSENLTVNNGASITAENIGQGKSGNLFVESTNNILLTNDPGVKPNLGGISALIQSGGDSGDLTVKAANLVVQNEASINTNNFGTGTSGNVIVDAGSILLSGNGKGDETGIKNNAFNTGRLGELSVTADSLKIQNGANISAGTFGALGPGNGAMSLT